MKTLKMKFRKMAAITLTAALMVGMFPMTASAQEELLFEDAGISEEQLIDEVLVEDKAETEEPVVSEQVEMQALTDDLAEPEVLTEQDDPETEQLPDDEAYEEVPEGDTAYVASVITKGGSATNYTDFDSAVGAWNSAGAGATLKLLENIESIDTVSVNGGIEGSPMVLNLNDRGILYTGSKDVPVVKVSINSYFELTDNSNEKTKKYIKRNSEGRGISVLDTPNTDCIEVTGGYISGGLGDPDKYGGGILNEGTIIMNGGDICANTAYTFQYGCAAGVTNWDTGTFIMNGGKISNNLSTGTYFLWGSGVGNRKGTFVMNGGEISCNDGLSSCGDKYFKGAGIYNADGMFFMNGGIISGNKAGSGGAVFNDGTFTMKRGRIFGNNASGDTSGDGGGAIYNRNGTFIMKGGEIFDNTTEKTGGGIINKGGRLIISRGKIYDNIANVSGNAVYQSSGEIEFKGTIQAGAALDGTDKATVSANEAVSHINEYGYVEVIGGHDFDYTANGATITAVCADEDCTLPNKTASITINAPDNLVYDGAPKKVNVTGDTEVIEKPDIKYYAEDGEETDNVIKAGTYTAKMTVENVTASVTFTIEKAEVLLTTPEPIDVTYSGTEKNLVNAGYTPDGTIYYAVMKTNTLPDDSKYSTAVPKAKDIGSYYVWYKVKADENHIDVAPKCVKAMINGKYTVTFDLNEKTGTAPDAQSIEKNGKAAKPADPTADGFKFAGWYTDKNCTMGYNFDALVISDITLYAKWIKAETNTVKVVFNMQGHGIQIPEQIIESGKKLIQPDDPIDSTKVFGGWYTEPECKTLFDFKKAVTADTNIYAKWNNKEITGLTAYFADEDLKYNAGLGRYEIVYTGEKIQPSVVVTNNATGDKELTLGTDYTISYTNNLNVDKNGKPAVVTVKGMGNYSGSKKLLFYILPKSLGSGADATPAADITLSNILVQSGSKVSPVICYKGYKLANKDFTVTSKTGSLKFTDADAAENRKVTIMGKGNFSGCIKDAPVTVLSKKELADKTINVSLANTAIIYNGKPQVLKEGTQLKVTAGGKSLSENYIVSYTDNINAGTAKVTVTGVNGYTGSVTKSFKIAPDKNTSTVTAQAPAKTAYDVNGAKPKVNVSTVRDGVKIMLAEGVDYIVTYSSNKKVTGKTKAKYTVKFMGNYKGRKSMTGTFEIEPAAFNADVKAVNLYYTKPGKYMSAPYVSIGGVLLTKKDYTVKYYVGETDITDKSYTLTGDSVNVKVVITGKGNYAATAVTVENCYTIRKAPENATDLSKIKVTMKGNVKKNLPAQQYTGQPVVPEFDIWVKAGNDWKNITESGLVKGTDYEVTIYNNVNKGNATILISAKSSSNKAINSKAVKFKIGQKKLTGADQILKL